ncbi:DUF3180 domain-containing protein [Amnibacterium endophyticum]|uniref:DUF3180 domain-containing protein n=1 Tax=Amnibacterium endophyticum TaxID=2109337 RepID=A0ABW4LFM7_9MICO
MRRTSAALLLGLAVAGGAVGWLLQVALASAGRPVFVPPVGTWAVLYVIAVAVVLVALPVRRSVHAGRAGRPHRHRVDPFYAMRALMLAKASSILGAFALGMGLALVGYAVSRTGDIETPAFWPSALLGLGGLVMMVAGLVAESWCRIPPEDRTDLQRTGAPTR